LGRDATEDAVNAAFGSERVGLATIAFTLIVFVVCSLLWPDPKPRAETDPT
jgi:hypothetical protein